VSFGQKGHFWAVDWLYPHVWCGTVATRVGNLPALAHGTAGPFTMMRNSRNMNTVLPNGGWHWSWLGGPEAAARKVGSFCHPEVEKQMPMDDLDWYWREGYHVGGGEGGAPVQMAPVEVDHTYPKWMQNRENVPDDWKAAMSLANLYPHLAPTDEDLEKARARLNDAYRDYVAHVSAAQMAISLETASFILWTCEQIGAATAVGFGSGFTSYVLRFAGCDTVSVDDTPEWLHWTRLFLERYDQTDGQLVLFDDWPRLPTSSYDFGSARDDHFITAIGRSGHDRSSTTPFEGTRKPCGGRHPVPLTVCSDRTRDSFGRYAALSSGQHLEAYQIARDAVRYSRASVLFDLRVSSGKKVIELGTRGSEHDAWLYAMELLLHVWSVDLDPPPDLARAQDAVQGNDLNPEVFPSPLDLGRRVPSTRLIVLPDLPSCTCTPLPGPGGWCCTTRNCVDRSGSGCSPRIR
jgi:hypothetical protein